jgi:hypothetical protein
MGEIQPGWQRQRAIEKGDYVARQGMVEAEGQVDKILGGGFYAVTLTNKAVVKVKLGRPGARGAV